MRAGARDIGAEQVRRCSVAGLARDLTLLGGSEPGRMPGVCLLWVGRAALCEMSAPAGAVTSMREAHPERPLAEPLPAASATPGWRILIMSPTPRCSGAAAQVRRLALAVPDGAVGGEGGRVFRRDSPSVFSSMR